MTIHELWERELQIPYAYGSTDCVMTVFRIADERTGSCYWEDYHGSYGTLMGAQKELRRRGFKTLVDFLDSVFPQRITPFACRSGDIAVYSDNGIQHAAVCLGVRFGIKTEDGPKYVMVDDIIAGYRVT